MGESCGIVHELTNKPSLLMLQHNYRSVLFVLVGGIRCGNCLRDLSRAKTRWEKKQVELSVSCAWLEGH